MLLKCVNGCNGSTMNSKLINLGSIPSWRAKKLKGAKMIVIKWYSIIILSFIFVTTIYQNVKKNNQENNLYITITLLPAILYMLFN